MRRSARLFSLAGGVLAIATAALLLLPLGKQTARDANQLTNDLCIVAPATPYDSASGLAMLAPRPIPADARCPVCGMYPARFPRWAAQSLFKDGAAHYFDSPLDLLVFLQKVNRHDRRYDQDDVAVSFVTDFETGQWIESRDAFFVHGSSVFGPMRDADLPALASREAADSLASSRGGRVLRFADVTPERVLSLNRSVHHRH